MRLAILADVHGNLPALEAVLADAQQHRADGIVVAGDFTDGPQAPEIIQWLRSLESCMIRGNRENYFLAYDRGEVPESWQVSAQWAGFRWMYRRLDREALDFVASLPEQRVVVFDSTTPIRVVHGSPQGVSELLLPDRDPVTLELFRQACMLTLSYSTVDATLAQIGEPVLVCGHSHIPWKQAQDGRLAVNPGSVGAPINGDVRAQYALLTWQHGHWQAEHRAVPYDLDRTRAAYHQSGLLEIGGAMARAFLRCVETGQNVPGRLVTYFRRLASKAGFDDYNTIPDAIWKQATETFDWQAATMLQCKETKR